MKAPLSWLREYVSTDATDMEIAQRLTISSLEVDRLVDVGVADAGGNLTHFVVGRVISADPHPNADRTRSRSSAAHGTSVRERPLPSGSPAPSCPASPARSRSGRSAARCPAG